MHASPALNMDRFFDNIICCYESRIQQIQTAFQSSENISESSHSLLDNVQHSLNDLKKERDSLNEKLCETLAKNGSLRKKDYYSLMSDILCRLEEMEKDAARQFLNYMEVQKETAQSLKHSLLGINDFPSQDNSEEISILRDQLAQITDLQEFRKETVMKAFQDFQQLHNRMISCFENLLEKGGHIQIQDIKNVKYQILKEINSLS